MSYSGDSDDGSQYSDDAEEQGLEYALYNHISSVDTAGSFATFDVIENFVHPGISVDGVGTVRLPLSEDDAQTLVRESHQAPFGKGTETVIDESVRKTWEIDAGKVQFLNTRWQHCLDQIVKNVAEELGVAGNVCAEFYKMLLYEKGAMFKPHKDTEKTPGMFGTLVICLPSQHTGGTVSLQHGTKQVRFDTGESSAFNATFIAWYADVIHEIEPLQTGFRWVLTYNLVKDSKRLELSASALDARMVNLRQTLMQWRDSGDGSQCFVYPLDHQYTDRGLRLAQLKGDDYHRARHVAQGCAEGHDFYVLLANMELCVTDPNAEEEEPEKERELRLTHIVDLEGSGLSLYSALSIPETTLLQQVIDVERDPDVQRGGEYWGNQHTEIEQFFKNSVLIIVPERFIMGFLLGRSASRSDFNRLIRRLKEHIKNGSSGPTSQNLLLQICQSSLSKGYKSDAHRDSWMGPVAVAAVFMRDASLFSKAVGLTARGFDKDSYSALGESICLQDHVVPENDIIEVLKKSGELHTLYSDLASFLEGFCRGNPDRGDQLRMGHLKRWLDAVTVESLNELTKTYAQDAGALVKIIADRSEDRFRQFVLYQAVRGFVLRFIHATNPLTPPTKNLLNALMVELLLNLQAPSSSQKFLESLLQRIVEPAIPNFHLLRYADYIKWRCSQGSNSTLLKAQGEKESIRAGPITAIHDRVCAHDGGKSSRLLKLIERQASHLTTEQSKDFLMPLMKELISVVDASSSVVQRCYQSLVTIYITQVVGQEPEKPSDWARPEEACECYHTCNVCPGMNEFLRNPEAKSLKISSDDKWHLRSQYNSFNYFEDESVNSPAVTKTLKWWEKQHQEWEGRASTAAEVLRQLPQAKLKECLAHRYDEIMDFRMVKVEDGSPRPESESKVGQRYQTRSTVGQKRSRDDS